MAFPLRLRAALPSPLAAAGSAAPSPDGVAPPPPPLFATAPDVGRLITAAGPTVSVLTTAALLTVASHRLTASVTALVYLPPAGAAAVFLADGAAGRVVVAAAAVSRRLVVYVKAGSPSLWVMAYSLPGGGSAAASGGGGDAATAAAGLPGLPRVTEVYKLRPDAPLHAVQGGGGGGSGSGGGAAASVVASTALSRLRAVATSSPAAPIVAVAMAADPTASALAATADSAGGVRVWDPARRSLVAVLDSQPLPLERLTGLAFHPGGAGVDPTTAAEDAEDATADYAAEAAFSAAGGVAPLVTPSSGAGHLVASTSAGRLLSWRVPSGGGGGGGGKAPPPTLPRAKWRDRTLPGGWAGLVFVPGRPAYLVAVAAASGRAVAKLVADDGRVVPSARWPLPSRVLRPPSGRGVAGAAGGGDDPGSSTGIAITAVHVPEAPDGARGKVSAWGSKLRSLGSGGSDATPTPASVVAPPLVVSGSAESVGVGPDGSSDGTPAPPLGLGVDAPLGLLLTSGGRLRTGVCLWQRTGRGGTPEMPGLPVAAAIDAPAADGPPASGREVVLASDALLVASGAVFSVALATDAVTRLASLPPGDARSLAVARDNGGAAAAALVFLSAGDAAPGGGALDWSTDVGGGGGGRDRAEGSSAAQYVLLTRRGEDRAWGVSAAQAGRDGAFLGPAGDHTRLAVLAPGGTTLTVLSFALPGGEGGERRGRHNAAAAAGRAGDGSAAVRRYALDVAAVAGGDAAAAAASAVRPDVRVARVWRSPLGRWSALVYWDAAGGRLALSANAAYGGRPIPDGAATDGAYALDRRSSLALQPGEAVLDVRWTPVPATADGGRGGGPGSGRRPRWAGAVLTTARLLLVTEWLVPTAAPVSLAALPGGAPSGGPPHVAVWDGAAVVLLTPTGALMRVAPDGTADVAAVVADAPGGAALLAAAGDRLVVATRRGASADFPALAPAPAGGALGSGLSSREAPFRVLSRALSRAPVDLAVAIAAGAADPPPGVPPAAVARRFLGASLAADDASQAVSATSLAAAAASPPTAGVAYLLSTAAAPAAAAGVGNAARARLLAAAGDSRGALSALTAAIAAADRGNPPHHPGGGQRGRGWGDWATAAAAAALLDRPGVLSALVDAPGGAAALAAVTASARQGGNRALAAALAPLVTAAAASPVASHGGVERPAVDALRADVRRLRGRLVLGDGTAAAPTAGVAVMVAAAAPAASREEPAGRRGSTTAAAAAADAEPIYTRTPLPRTALTAASDRVATRVVASYTPLRRGVDGVVAGGRAAGVPGLPAPPGGGGAGPTPLQLTAPPGGDRGAGGGLGTVDGGGGEDLLPVVPTLEYFASADERRAARRAAKAAAKAAAAADVRVAAGRSGGGGGGDSGASDTSSDGDADVGGDAATATAVRVAVRSLRGALAALDGRDLQSALLGVNATLRSLAGVAASAPSGAAAVPVPLLTAAVHYRFAVRVWLALAATATAASSSITTTALWRSRLASALAATPLRSDHARRAVAAGVDAHLAAGNAATAAAAIRVLAATVVPGGAEAAALAARAATARAAGGVDAAPPPPPAAGGVRVDYVSLTEIPAGAPALRCSVCPAVFGVGGRVIAGGMCAACRVGRAMYAGG
ncbi:hypothetical protein MMPV_009110 [Pyropia vietnamensis]